jgi:hypothetical protein
MKIELIIPAILAATGIGVLVAYGLQLQQRQAQVQPTATPSAASLTTTNVASSTTAVLVGGNPGDRVNIRSQPSTGAAVLYQAPIGSQITVLRNAQGSDLSRWYYVSLGSAQQGWIHSSLVRIASSSPTANSSPIPVAPSTPTQAALVGCRSRVERQLGTQIQVSPGSQNQDGTYRVNWQADTGAAGYCRVSSNGNVVQYVNNVFPRSPASVSPSPS